MAMTEGDKALCQEYARLIIQEVLTEHIKACPIGRSLLKFTCLSIGIAIGSGFVSSGVVLAVAKLVLSG
jgi:hypothetical protein